MASLNTLRTKGGVVISIVIGIALVAFVLGDISSRGCTNNSVGSIDGTTISYDEYSSEAERYNIIAQGMLGKEVLNSEETDAARNMAWESLVFKYSFRPSFEKLGLWVSEAEQIDMVNGVYISPVISSTFVNQQTGVYEPALLRNFIASAEYDPTGRSIIIWNYLKGQMNEQRTMSKYVSLVTKGMYVNDLELKANLEGANKISKANVVPFSYSEIPDSLITISGNDIRAYYNNNKNRFKQKPAREIEYVVFDMLPSEQDYQDAEEYISIIAEEFKESDAPMQYATLNSQSAPNQRYLKEDEVEGAIAAAIFNKPDDMYGPVLTGDVYVLARQADMKMLPDTIGAKHILLEPEQKELADSLIGVLRKGGKFDELAREYSIEEAASVTGGDLGRFTPDQMVPEFSDRLIVSKPGDIFTVESRFGLHIVEMTYRTALVPKVQIATIRYTVDPSAQTQQAVYAEASQFLGAAAGSYDNFNKAATEAALAKRVARVSNTDRTVNGIEDSKELIRWAFENKKGQVSDIKEIGGDYVVAVVTGIREEGMAKVEDVADIIRPILIREKKAEMIINDKIKGSTLQEIASASGNEVVELESVTFDDFYFENIGFEPKLVGAIAATSNLNKLSKPVIGQSGVFVFEVAETFIKEGEDAISEEDERIKMEAMSTSYIEQRLSQAMSEVSKTTDNRIKFF